MTMQTGKRRVGRDSKAAEDAQTELERLRREVKELAARAEPQTRQLELPVAAGNVVPIAPSVPAPVLHAPEPDDDGRPRGMGSLTDPYVRYDGVEMVKVTTCLPIPLAKRLRRFVGYLVTEKRNDWMARVLDEALKAEEARLGLTDK